MSIANLEVANNNNVNCKTLSCKNMYLGDFSSIVNFYTQSTYTANISDSSSNPLTLDTSNSYCYVATCGSIINFNCTLAWSSKGSAIAGDVVQISLPTIISSSYKQAVSFSIGYMQGVVASTVVSCSGTPNTNTAQLYSFNTGSGNSIALKVSDLASSGVICISGFFTK